MKELVKILNTYNKIKDINKTAKVLELNVIDLQKLLSKFKLIECTFSCYKNSSKPIKKEKRYILYGLPGGAKFVQKPSVH